MHTRHFLLIVVYLTMVFYNIFNLLFGNLVEAKLQTFIYSEPTNLTGK